MDEKLSRATWAGETAALNSLLREKPFILSDSAMINSQENILNTSIKAGHIEISLKIAKTNPQLLTFQDQDGVRPLDVASAYGSVYMVRELLVLGPIEICRLPGRDGKVAIHHAVINGRIDVVRMLMEKCPDCVRDLTSLGESTLHLSARYYKFEVLKSLLQWLKDFGMMEVVNWKDKQGNTVLHYAALRKQIELAELLLDKNCVTRNVLEVNAPNTNGLSAMDLLNVYIESPSDVILKELFQQAGGLQSNGTTTITATATTPDAPPHPNLSIDNIPKNWEENMARLKFNWQRDSAGEARNGLLVVAVLFVTVAFQAGTNLPSHIFPDKDGELARQFKLAIFFTLNTFILSASMSIIYYVTAGMPFRREVNTAAWCLMGSYGFSLGATKLPLPIMYLITMGVPFTMLAFRILPELYRKARNRIRGDNSTQDLGAP